MIYEFFIPTQIIFTAGGLSQLPSVAGELGKKPLLITGRSSMRRLGITSRVINALEKEELRVTLFERVEPNPRVTTIDDAARIFREQKLDLIVALGGGSVMDAAKGVAMAVSGTKSIWYYIENQAQPEGNVPPIIAIPTVAASGSESNCGRQ